jgi:anaerobic selenocysteine-containing dehydrogenase
MYHISRARKERGAKLVVIDPYRTRTAAVADHHLMLRPGSDAALACAVMHVLFEEGYADLDYIARLTDDPPGLRQHLSARSPAWAAPITGLSIEQIVHFARLYGSTKRSYVRLGYGFSRSRNGAISMHAASCLPSVTGAWQHRGGGALYSNRDLYHIDKTLIEGLDARDPTIRMLDMSRIGPVLIGDRQDLGDGPPVTAMLVQNCNPAVVAPESIKVRAGLTRDDLFLCVHEQFMTDTARLADIVLPATTFLEHDDLYQGGGHQHLQIAPKVIEPYAEARPNHAVLCGLASRLGAEHRGFRMSEWEIIDETLRRSGWPDADSLAAMRWLDCQPDFETSHHLKGFPNRSGRFRFAPDWAAAGPDHAHLPKLPDYCPIVEAADADHPFRLVAAPAHNFLNTTFTETPTSRRTERAPGILVHPDDCARLGLTENSLAAIGNRRGEIRVAVHPFSGVQPGVVVIESIWPNGDFVDGLGVNALTSADAGPPNGGAVFHDTAVWVRAA